MGLFWAARGSLLSAASLATSEIWNYGNINGMQIACYNRLKWLELRLGRIPQALDWHNLDLAICNISIRKEFQTEALSEQTRRFDLALGIMFLRSELSLLKTMELLPNVLERLSLDFSPVALIYALGDFAKIPPEFTQAVSKEEMEDFFAQWVKQYTPEYFPSALAVTETSTVLLNSVVLGCEIIIKTINNSPCLEISESILAAIESFLSTTVLRHSIAHESLLKINVDATGKDKLIEYSVQAGDGGLVVSIHCQKFNPHMVSAPDQEQIKKVIYQILIEITGRIMIFKDLEKDLKEMMGNEKASERAIDFTSSFITLGNVLGDKPKIKLSEWFDRDCEHFELKRKKAIVFDEDQPKSKHSEPKGVDRESFMHAKHTDITSLPIIKLSLWEEAKWMGVGYIVVPNNESPPFFIPIFSNIDAGKKIFSGWTKRLGNKDEKEEIKVSVISGFDKYNPMHYKVGIGASLKALENERQKNSIQYYSTATRIHIVTPQSHQNLNNFQSSYNQFGCYIFAPGFIGKDGGLDIIFDHGIIKREISFKEAWELEPSDLDAVLISPDDKPIIPSGVKNSPVQKLFESRKKILLED